MSGRRLLALDAPLLPDDVAGLLPRLRDALAGTGPALMLLPPGPEPLRWLLLEAADTGCPLERDDVAVVAPTSGSTGAPRLALLTAGALAASATATADRLGGPGGWVLTLPSHYVAGLMVLVRSVLAGRDPVAMDLRHGFTPEAFAEAVRTLSDREPGFPHHTALVPTQLARLLDADDGTAALAGLDAVLLGGAAAPPGLLERARQAGVRVVTTYGMTETCGGCVYDGVPLAGTEVDVDAEGRVRLRGTTLFCGYRGRSDLTEQALVGGWFRTSDAGRLANGRLDVLGRLDEVVTSGGVKVPPEQVEAVLATHPAVAQVVVVGRPDPTWGQTVVAVVEGAGQLPTLADLRSHARPMLDPAWLPRAIVPVERMPLLPSGKPDRQAVRTLVAAPAR